MALNNKMEYVYKSNNEHPKSIAIAKDPSYENLAHFLTYDIYTSDLFSEAILEAIDKVAHDGTKPELVSLNSKKLLIYKDQTTIHWFDAPLQPRSGEFPPLVTIATQELRQALEEWKLHIQKNS